MKVKAVLVAAEVGRVGLALALHYRPIMILRVKDLSVSIHVGTRKMVNYA
jgi:hypothetical protein